MKLTDEELKELRDYFYDCDDGFEPFDPFTYSHCFGTCLHAVAWGSDQKKEALRAAELLIKGGADVNNDHGDMGSTPLWEAENNNFPELIQLLKLHGAVSRSEMF